MKYLLDTNVVSELRKVGDGKADANVTKWVGAQDSNDLFISAITILEIERGTQSRAASSSLSQAAQSELLRLSRRGVPSQGKSLLAYRFD